MGGIGNAHDIGEVRVGQVLAEDSDRRWLVIVRILGWAMLTSGNTILCSGSSRGGRGPAGKASLGEQGWSLPVFLFGRQASGPVGWTGGRRSLADLVASLPRMVAAVKCSAVAAVGVAAQESAVASDDLSQKFDDLR